MAFFSDRLALGKPLRFPIIHQINIAIEGGEDVLYQAADESLRGVKARHELGVGWQQGEGAGEIGGDDSVGVFEHGHFEIPLHQGYSE